MSKEELQIAAKAYGSHSNVHFVTALAQNLPFSSETFDLIGAHMSIMLMRPIEPAIGEMFRVLKKGGRIAAITTSTMPATGTLKAVNDAILSFIKVNYPKFSQLPNGDLRTRSLEGIQELFLPRFSLIEQYKPFFLNVVVSPEETWEFCNTLVSVNLLPQSKRTELRKIVIEIADGQPQQNGKVTLQMPLSLWVIQK
jgi:ubiquinone/menaquinone biosynthesis C-methylase UbiE